MRAFAHFFAALLALVHAAGCQSSDSFGPEEARAENAAPEILAPKMLAASFAYHRNPRPAGSKAKAVMGQLLSQSHMRAVMDLQDARHLLYRTGFGASPSELDRVIGMTRADAVRAILNEFGKVPRVSPPSFISHPAPAYGSVGDLHPADRDAFIQARHREIAALRQWWLQEMAVTPSPLTEKMVLFWHNHFVSAYSGVDEWSHGMARQHFLFRRHLKGHFDDMLYEIIRDPAMLNYLDNDQNRKKKPNENLARELMELFTLGVGAYSEKDVKEAARALAGWGVSENANLSFKRKPWAEDTGSKSILGHRGRFDADDLIDILIEQDALPDFVARKIWAYFGSSIQQDDAAITSIASAFRASDLSLETLLVAVFTQDAFWDPQHRGTLIKAPADIVVGAVRSLSLEGVDPGFLAQSMARLGQTLFEPPNVAGWSGGVDWISPGALLARDAVIHDLLALSTPASVKIDNRFVSLKSDSRSMDPAVQHLAVTLAGEDWNGPAEWRAWVVHDGGTWRSDQYEVQRGHDTQRLGRVESEADLVWERTLIRVPASLSGIRRVGIEFLNDGAGSDGDRNLFIQSIEWDGSAIPASLGEQSPGCRSNPKGAERNPGSLYCRGALSFKKPVLDLAKADDALMITRDTIYADRLYIQHANLTSKNRATIGILLENLVLNDRRWALFGFELVRERDGQIGLALQEGECFPRCLTSWPRAHWGKEGTRSVFFPIPFSGAYAGGDARQQWSGLAEEDKQLVSALVSLLPEVVAYIPESRRAKRNPRRLKQWMPILEDMASNQGTIWDDRTQAFTAVIATKEQKMRAQMLQAQMMMSTMSTMSTMGTMGTMRNATRDDMNSDMGSGKGSGMNSMMAGTQPTDMTKSQDSETSWQDVYYQTLSRLGTKVQPVDVLFAVPPIGARRKLEALLRDPAWQVM